jgi:hypothetical protein
VSFNGVPLGQYINNNSQVRGESLLWKRRRKICNSPKRNKEEAGGQRQDLNYHSLPTPSSRPAVAPTTNTAMGKDISESVARTPPPPPTPPLFNLHEYFQPVFDEVDKLNKMLDSHIEQEK